MRFIKPIVVVGLCVGRKKYLVQDRYSIPLLTVKWDVFLYAVLAVKLGFFRAAPRMALQHLT